MEGSGKGGRKNVGSSDSRPPNPLGGLVRHPSLSILPDVSIESETGDHRSEIEFMPIVRSGAWADIGSRQNMEDTYVCCNDLAGEYGFKNSGDGPYAYYAVFDGHDGKHAAEFVRSNLLRLIMEDEDFPKNIDKVVNSAFLQADTALAEACSIDTALASGTTALAALILGRILVVANVGDCRAVLCRRGQAIAMSRDHKPSCIREKKRIEATGGFVSDGYLNGRLNVTRALGDWHMEGMKDPDGLGPLSAEPEVMKMKLTEEDEFLIMGCDGIWDVFRSQNAVDFARRKLQEHNDPEACGQDLVCEALKRKSCDNLAVIVICFSSKAPPALAAPRSRFQRSISAEGLKELQGFLDSL
ncbi:hypothetical protein HPP92_023334 [Vanilla planifolia]|uniref:protein-serine/threonine phosphatase n=1 Tax=Vanilla planifolia TaxID=51239 RepID=A0A835PVA6_VANPL|nr:hypothetical protein HPP92_023334 [Vanilla planifolia]